VPQGLPPDVLFAKPRSALPPTVQPGRACSLLAPLIFRLLFFRFWPRFY